MREVGFEPTNS